MRTKLAQSIASIAVLLGIAGCSGLTQVQHTISKFDQGAHSVSTSEMAFLQSTQKADCNYQFYTAAFEYANNPARVPKTPLNLEAPCAPDVMPNQDIATRQKVMNAVTLYADQLQAIASTGTDKTLSANAQKTATDLNKLATSQGLLTSTGPIAADVESAIAGLARMVLAGQQLQDIKQAASAQSGNLATVVNYLTKENTQLAMNMNDKAAAFANMLNATIRQEKKNGDRHLLLDILAARRLLQNSNKTRSTQHLNASLDSLVSANDAIAKDGTGGVVGAVSDLVARAQAAQAMQAALNK